MNTQVDALLPANELRIGDTIIKVVAGEWTPTGRIKEITQFESGCFEIWLTAGLWQTRYMVSEYHPFWVRRY